MATKLQELARLRNRVLAQVKGMETIATNIINGGKYRKYAFNPSIIKPIMAKAVETELITALNKLTNLIEYAWQVARNDEKEDQDEVL